MYKQCISSVYVVYKHIIMQCISRALHCFLKVFPKQSCRVQRNEMICIYYILHIKIKNLTTCVANSLSMPMAISILTSSGIFSPEGGGGASAAASAASPDGSIDRAEMSLDCC